MIGLAAIVGAVALFLADMWLGRQTSSAPEVRIVEVSKPEKVFKTIVVATEPLAFGSEVKREQLAEIPWAEDAIPEGALPSIDELLKPGSRVVLAAIQPNEPVLLSKLSGPGGKATLSTLLGKGMRAVPIREAEIADLNGLVTPGDRVDIVLTRDAGQIRETEINAKGAAGQKLTTEVVMENVKVLSVGDPGKEGGDKGTAVTVEVTPEGAQKITLARSVGQISLSLRGVDSQETAATGVTTISSFSGSAVEGLKQTVTDALAKDAARPETRTVIVTRGVETTSYTVISPKE